MTLREILAVLCRTSPLPQAEIAKRAGLSVNALRKRLCGAIGLSADDLQKLLHALDTNWADLGDIVEGRSSPSLFLAQESRRRPREARYHLRNRKPQDPRFKPSDIPRLAEDLEELRLLRPEKALDQAQRCFHALRDRDPADDPRTHTLVYISLGASWAKRGKTSAAAKALHLALRIARHEPALAARVLQATSTFAVNQTSLEVALRAAQLAILEALNAGSRRQIGRGFAAQGVVYGLLGLHSQSQLSYTTAQHYLRTGTWYERVAVLQGLGISLIALDDLDASNRAIGNALRLILNCGRDISESVLTKGPLLWLKSEIFLKRGSFTEAISNFQEVLFLYEDGGSPLDLVLISLRLAEAYLGARQNPGQLWTYLQTLLGPLSRSSPSLAELLADFLTTAIRGRASVEVVRRTYSALAQAPDVPTPLSSTTLP